VTRRTSAREECLRIHPDRRCIVGPASRRKQGTSSPTQDPRAKKMVQPHSSRPTPSPYEIFPHGQDTYSKQILLTRLGPSHLT